MTESFVDLHIHTNFSDGTFTPEEAVRYARDKGLSAIAITDHDNIDGILPAVKEGAKIGVEVVPGVELSAEYEENSVIHEIHVLGFFIDWENKEFSDKLTFFREARKQRAQTILEKLGQTGINLDQEAIATIGGKGSIGRLHFARLLIEGGHVGNVPEAFHRYLGYGKPAYEPKFKLKGEEAIKLIADAKGISVLAHPYYGGFDTNTLVKTLAAAGLGGIEAWHIKHTKHVAEGFVQLAQDNNLLVTGGSDCHGAVSSEQTPAMGNQKIPYQLLQNLKKYKKEHF